MTAEPSTYAAGLRDYAESILDGWSLHCWMVQRLMLDLGLEHGRAAEVVDDVLAHERPGPRPRRRPRRLRATRLIQHRA